MPVQVREGDGKGGKRVGKREVCCERKSAYEDIDLASVDALVKLSFWKMLWLTGMLMLGRV